MGLLLCFCNIIQFKALYTIQFLMNSVYLVYALAFRSSPTADVSRVARLTDDMADKDL